MTTVTPLQPKLLHRIAYFAPLAAAICGVTGCDKEDAEIRTYQVSKTLPLAPLPQSELESPANSPIAWTVPPTWKQTPSNEQMRFATFVVSPDHPDVVLTVVPLPGAAGSLQQNVNRWEKMIGLPPSSEADLPHVVTHATIGGDSADLVDLQAPEPTDGTPRQRMLAAILQHEGQNWFFKLTGPFDVVTSESSRFVSFVRSVHFPGTAAPAQSAAAPTPVPTPQAPPSAPDRQSPFSYHAPAQWVKQATTNQFRVIGFDIPAGGLVAVTRMPANSGSALDNVNRWRGQVGLEPLADAAGVVSEKTKVGGSDTTIYRIEGKSKDGAPAQAITVALVERDGTWWFFKLQGPATLVAEQTPAFKSFLDSVQFNTGETR